MRCKNRITLAVVVCCLFAAVLQASPITVNVYETFTPNVPGVYDPAAGTFTNLVSTFGASDINFLNPWMPSGLLSSNSHAWGAIISGTLYAPSAGSYPLTITSDDAAALYLNGSASPVFDDQPAHAPMTTGFNVTLNAGANPFEIRYIEWNNLPAELIMNTGDLHYTPEPATYGLLGAGLFVIAALGRRRKTS